MGTPVVVNWEGTLRRRSGSIRFGTTSRNDIDVACDSRNAQKTCAFWRPSK